MIAGAIDEPASVGLVAVVEHDAARVRHQRPVPVLCDLDRGPGKGNDVPFVDSVLDPPPIVAGPAVEHADLHLRPRKDDPRAIDSLLAGGRCGCDQRLHLT